MFSNIKQWTRFMTIATALMLGWSVFSAIQVFSRSITSATPAGDMATPITILKPGETPGFMPTPVPDAPLPPNVKPVEPGQPALLKPRPSRAELEKLAQRNISPDTPLKTHLVVDKITDSKLASFGSDTIVIAHVSRIHPALWNTTDGQRPSDPYDVNHPSQIYTVVDIEIEKALRGDGKPGDILAVIKPGGRVGEDSVEVENYPTEFTEGQNVLLYLDPISVDQVPGVFWRVNERYTIDPATNVATTPFEQRSLDDLLLEVNQANVLKQQLMQQKP